MTLVLFVHFTFISFGPWMYSEAGETLAGDSEKAGEFPSRVMAKVSGTPLKIGANVTATLNAGSVFQVVKRNGEWLWIDSGNVRGWVKSSAVVAIDDAVEVFSKAIEQEPDVGDGYLGRGLAREAHGNHDDALVDFTKTIELDHANHWAYHNRATVYHAKRDFAHALSDSDAAIRLDASEPAHWANRASVQFAQGDFDKAIADYSEAITRLQGDEVTFEDEGMSGKTRARRLSVKWMCARAECWAAKNANQKAAWDYSEAARIDPGDPLTFNAFAWLLATVEDSSVRDGIKAFDLAARACDLTDFRNHICIDTLAAAYACAGDFAAAVKWQVSAISLAGQDDRLSAGYRLRLDLFMKNKPIFNPTSP